MSLYPTARSIRPAFLMAMATLIASTGSAPGIAAQIPTPLEHFGHEMGASKNLARWDRITEYFEIVADASDRIVVDTTGLSTNGYPFVVITISSRENLARIGEIRSASKEIADRSGTG